ncbi:MAG: CoA transferase [Deltaproteobacteria bacterium]|nr:CoA transferase [Deltaproteobacteria bacterium]
MAGALDGIKILELTRVGPGAFCTMMLADMGAEVLKIEPPPTGKLAGSGASPRPEQARKLATSFTNRNKQSLTLNLKEPAGQAVLQDLAKSYDVLLEGFRPGVMQRLGGDYDTLSKINPRLIYCSLSGFGQDGPYRDFPAHDLNYLSLAGVANLIGPTEGPPSIPLNIIADYAGASMHGVTGIMFALFARERTGKGQMVDVSYLDTTISLLAATPNVRDYFADAVMPGRGNGVFGGGHAYYGFYGTKDGKMITIGCTEPWLFENLCDALNRPDLKDCAMKEGDFSGPANARHAQARQELQKIFLTKTRQEWFDILTKADVCVGQVYDVPEVFEDPQVKHRQMAVELDHPVAGKVTQAGIAVKLSDTPGSIRSFAPSLGQHTDAVLRGIGYSDAKIAELRGKQVV